MNQKLTTQRKRETVVFIALDSLNFPKRRLARQQNFYRRVGAQTAELEIEHPKSRAEAGSDGSEGQDEERHLKATRGCA